MAQIDNKKFSFNRLALKGVKEIAMVLFVNERQYRMRGAGYPGYC